MEFWHMKMKPSEKYNFFYFLDFLTVPSKSRCRFFICQSVFLKMTERRKERKKKEKSQVFFRLNASLSSKLNNSFCFSNRFLKEGPPSCVERLFWFVLTRTISFDFIQKISKPQLFHKTLIYAVIFSNEKGIIRMTEMSCFIAINYDRGL